MSVVCLIFLAWLTALPFTLSQALSLPREILTSAKQYGPDGPWQAVRVSLGNPPQLLDLYPGGTYGTIILTDTVCNGILLASCGTGGLFEPARSKSLITTKISTSGPELDWTLGAMNNSGEAQYVMDQLTLAPTSALDSATVPNLSVLMVTNVTTTYPDGTTYPLQLGQLALGPSNTGQIRDQNEWMLPSSANLIPGYLWKNGTIGSASYGLHIGSATLNIPLSLWLGGYDQSRVIGPVNTLPSHNSFLDNFFIDLIDIGIAVDHGGSPFTFFSTEGLLAKDNSSINSPVSVNVNPAAPYLYLPRSTCDAIAKDLPVTYQPKYGLYFWDLEDSRYHDIVTSPSYLSFRFRAPNRQLEDLTIKVPFALLNLTLEQPLVNSPTLYFPCQPPQGSSTYALGRAFLQAAFIGIVWNENSGHWYLAQAPGPDIPTSPTPTTFTDSINGSSTDWSETWRSHWTPLTDAHSRATDRPPSPSATRSLSNGAYAGIGVGSAAMVCVAVLAYVFVRRRRHGKETSTAIKKINVEDVSQNLITHNDGVHEAAGPEPAEISGGKRDEAWEMPHQQCSEKRVELE
ncbi:MAG: hypothetical protein L6R40_001619 [Gallowayella cf. fulva]|nr:MAG: hypothetical protein L6R40_001619 [Xanthomendoza cf. fulva]